MFKTLNALVLREVRYKEADRILTLLTDTEGKITAKARGALRKSSRTAAATQQLTYAEMTLFGNRGRWTVNEAVVKEPFEGLRGDMEKLALGAFFAECMEALSVEDQPEPDLLQLGLNCLYALSRDLCAQEKIKAAFETRLMCLSGYAPELGVCPVCGREPEDAALSLDHGCVCCARCGGMGEKAALGPEALAVLRYLGAAPAKQLLFFKISDAALLRLGGASERYLLRRAERGFSTLDYWKKIKNYTQTGYEK
jgi:DNA repair protein RecO (recombination protein O)